MTTRWNLPALALGIGIGLAAAGVSLAAAGAARADVPEASDYTAATVPAATPFGTLPVDTSISGATAFNLLLATLTEAQTDELNERCAVVIGQSYFYAEGDVVFCSRFYFAQGTLPYPEVDEPDAGNDAGDPYHDDEGNVTNDAWYDL